MKRILICTGVLGGGTALVFAAAALAASFAPAGDLIPGAWQQTGVMRGGAVMWGGGMGPNLANNFGVVTVTGTVGSGNAPAPAIDLPLPVQPIGSEAP